MLRPVPSRRLVLLAIAVLTLTAQTPARAQSTGVPWLVVPPDPRAAALGNAVVSNVTDASSVMWNPAGLAGMVGGEGQVAHVESFADLRREFASLARNFGGYAVGAHFEGVWTENLDGYDEAGNFTGTFGFNGYAAGVAGAVPIGENIRVGAGAKYIREAISTERATGWAVDLGAQYLFSELPVTAGVAVLNLGPKMSYISEEFSLPRVIQGGASYMLMLPSLRGGLLVSGEYRDAKDRDGAFLVGVEYQHQGLVSLGFGYLSGSGMDYRDVGFGVGFRRDRLRVQYAFAPYTDSLIGDEHRIGLGLRVW